MPRNGESFGVAVKKADRRYVYRRLWVYVKRCGWLLIPAFALVVASNVLALFGPALSGKAIDAMGLGSTNFALVFKYFGLMLGLYAVSGVLSYALSYIMIRVSRKVSFELRRDLFRHLGELPVDFYDTRQTGDIISVISYDVDNINASISNDLLQIFKSAIMVIGSLVMMLRIKPELVLVFCVTVPLSVFLTRYISRRIRPLYRKRSAKLGELNGFAEEMTGGQKTTRAYNMEDAVLSAFEKKNKEAVDAYTKAEYCGTLMGPSVNFINNLSLALVSVFGALMFITGNIGLGQISSFVLYSRKFSGPINETANIFGDIQSALAAAERVFRLMDAPAEKPDAKSARELENVRGDVRLSSVTFGYDPNTPIIRELSLSAKRGQLIAIVGPTGAGKTTIINLLMRFYDADSGSITVDGGNIKKLTRKSLRRAYTMVLQDTWLFSGTIFENIAYGKENATREEVESAARAAHAHGFISRLPEGYDTVLTDNATNISKGQKQLLTIARAMLVDSHMLILDEATSNVDTRTEQRIQSAMRRLMADKTCFVIAHRLSTIQNADLIAVLDGGRIAERGTHEQLLKKNCVYARLYYSQFEAAQ